MLERNNEHVYQPPAKFTEELRQRINNAGFSDEFKQQIKSAQKEEGRKMFERLTERSPKNGMAYLINVKQNEQVVESPYPNTLRCIMDSFDRLAAYEDSGLSPEEVQELAKAKADGRLVERGTWINGYCSNCNSPIPTDSKDDYIAKNECRFCYYCGAKMEEAAEKALGGAEDGK